MGWIGCVRCEKFQCDLMAQTCPLIAPVQHVLHQVSCSNETLKMHPNTTKMHQNMSLGFNGVDRMCSLPKIPMWVRGTNFCINCTVQPISHRVSCSNETIQNAPKHCKTHQFM